MRNKAKDFPYGNENKFQAGKPVQNRNMPQSEQMAQLTPHPQERMRASGARQDGEYERINKGETTWQRTKTLI